MPWPKTGATHYNAQLGHQDKGHAIKEFVFLWVLPYFTCVIKRVVLQFKRRVCSRWREEDLYPEASKEFIQAV